MQLYKTILTILSMQQKTNINVKKIGTVIALVIAVFFLYETWCPFEQIIGIPCPGCNMLSALYHLCLLDVQTALFFHPLIIVFCIYALIEFALYLKYKTLYTKAAKYIRIIFFTLLFIVYIYRMMFVYPNYPMTYNEHSIFNTIFNLFT